MLATSTAEAWRRVSTRGSSPCGTSIEAMMRSIRRRLSAVSVITRVLLLALAVIDWLAPTSGFRAAISWVATSYWMWKTRVTI